MIYHGGGGLDDLPRYIEQACAALRPVRESFDSIVCQGMSGVIVGVPVSLKLGAPLVIVRKDDDECHSNDKFIGLSALGTRCLFLDDFIGCGTTRRRVENRIADHQARLVGDYLYRDGVLEIRESDRPPLPKDIEKTLDEMLDYRAIAAQDYAVRYGKPAPF